MDTYLLFDKAIKDVDKTVADSSGLMYSRHAGWAFAQVRDSQSFCYKVPTPLVEK